MKHSRLSSAENPVGGMTFRCVWQDVLFHKAWYQLGKQERRDVRVFLYTVNY